MLDLAILGLLRDVPRHGYELKQQLAELGFWKVSFGSLYPALRRLEKRGQIEALRATGRRKAYRLTEEGHEAFQVMLREESDEPEEDRRFNLRLAFFRYLEPALRITTLERRRRQLVDLLVDSRRTLREAQARRGTIDRYTLALMERTVRSTEADIAWLDELISAERVAGRAAASTPEHSGGTVWAK
ncbi:MAG: PadR family transcriptional regulator [Acidimicrobiia bacterium]|nr:PadR family transcriptional regulator [Acidimicrobiia bacterium]